MATICSLSIGPLTCIMFNMRFGELAVLSVTTKTFNKVITEKVYPVLFKQKEFMDVGIPKYLFKHCVKDFICNCCGYFTLGIADECNHCKNHTSFHHRDTTANDRLWDFYAENGSCKLHYPSDALLERHDALVKRQRYIDDWDDEFE